MKINVPISYNDKKKCLDFAKSIISSNNQYNRFNKDKYIQIQRTFIGKLAEYLFLQFLLKRGVLYSEDGMFELYEGQTNVDNYDFVTKDKKTVDIKTASKNFHKRIMVPIDQWSLEKDFYVGIKINASYNGKEMILSKTNSGTIFGYCSRRELENSTVSDFGEGPCKHYLLENLSNINTLIKKFEN